MKIPVIDIHCDLLSYLLIVPGADPLNQAAIGCSLPALKEGNVKLQVQAIFASTERGSSLQGRKQASIFKELLVSQMSRVQFAKEFPDKILLEDKISIFTAVENASAFCEEDESLESGFQNLEEIISTVGKIFYIGMTHHTENRFGGGNNSKAGLKPDGERLLEFLDKKKIAIDLSHASDPLANGILEYIDKHSLSVPVMASHSNFRKVFDHPRNLPDDIALEIIKRKGLIGMNFLRAFLNNDDPDALYDHILYGLKLGGEGSLCFGADFFYTASHPDQSRRPFFNEQQGSAAKYPAILEKLSGKITGEQITALANNNVLRFLRERIC